jgi:hypothetical protein
MSSLRLAEGYAVVQLVEALRYKPEGRGFDFKHAAHSPFFSSKCRLFHNATFFGSCIIQILHIGCAKI